MAILGNWVSMTGCRRTAPAFVHDLSVKVDAHAGIDRVEFAIVANGTPHSTLTASALSMRFPNFSDQPSRMPGVASGMASFWGHGVSLDLSTVPAGTIVVTATIFEVGGASRTLPTTMTVFNDTDGTDRRPRAVTIYADGTDGNDANNGTSWAQAVRSLRRARSLAASGNEIGGARILCRGTFTDLSAGSYPNFSTSGDWWCEMVADAAGAFLNPPSTISNRYLSSGVGGTGSTTVICKNRFVGFRIGPNPLVSYSYGGIVWNWFDGCYSEATNYIEGRYSVNYADPAQAAQGDFCGWDGAPVGRRFYTGCSVRGFADGYEVHQFLFDCDAIGILGIACKYGSGVSEPVTGAFRMQGQRYAARTVHGFVRMDSDPVQGKGRPACTVTIPVAGTARITAAPGSYDFSIDADDLVGATYWGLRFEGSGATNLDTGVGLLVTNRGNDAGSPWVEVAAPGAVAGSWAANTCSFYTARTSDGMNYWNIHPDGVQFEADTSRATIFDTYLVDCPDTQSFFTSSIEAYDLDLCLLDNLRDDGSGLNNMPWVGSDVTNCIMQRFTITGQWTATGSASGWAGTYVRNCVFGTLGSSASTIGSRGATVTNCHVISGAPFGTNGTSGAWFLGDPATPPWPYEPSSGNKGTGSTAVVDPPAWAYSGTGSTRGVLKNVGNLDWSLPAEGNSGSASVTVGITTSATATNAIDGAAAVTVGVTTSAAATNAIAGSAATTVGVTTTAAAANAISGAASVTVGITTSATATNSGAAPNEATASVVVGVSCSATAVWVQPVPAQQSPRAPTRQPATRRRRGGIWRWLPPWG